MRTGRNDGFALVAALWLLVALGAVGLQTALASQARRQAAANLLDQVRAVVRRGADAKSVDLCFLVPEEWQNHLWLGRSSKWLEQSDPSQFLV